MNKLTSSLTLLALTLFGCTIVNNIPVSPQNQYSSQAQPESQPQTALVYFYNIPNAVAGMWARTLPFKRYAILEGDQNGKEIAVIGCGHMVFAMMGIQALCKGSYTWMRLPAGQYDLTAMFIEHRGNGIPHNFNLEGGKVYYIKVTQFPAAYAPNITLTMEPADIATAGIQSYLYCHGFSCDIQNDDTYDLTYQHKLAEQQQAQAQERNKKLEAELHCTDEQTRNGTCQ